MGSISTLSAGMMVFLAILQSPTVAVLVATVCAYFLIGYWKRTPQVTDPRHLDRKDHP